MNYETLSKSLNFKQDIENILGNDNQKNELIKALVSGQDKRLLSLPWSEVALPSDIFNNNVSEIVENYSYPDHFLSFIKMCLDTKINKPILNMIDAYDHEYFSDAPQGVSILSLFQGFVIDFDLKRKIPASLIETFINKIKINDHNVEKFFFGKLNIDKTSETDLIKAIKSSAFYIGSHKQFQINNPKIIEIAVLHEILDITKFQYQSSDVSNILEKMIAKSSDSTLIHQFIQSLKKDGYNFNEEQLSIIKKTNNQKEYLTEIILSGNNDVVQNLIKMNHSFSTDQIYAAFYRSTIDLKDIKCSIENVNKFTSLIKKEYDIVKSGGLPSSHLINGQAKIQVLLNNDDIYRFIEFSMSHDAFTLDELSLFAKQLKELDNCDEKNNTIHTIKQYMQKHFPTHTTTSSPSFN